MGENLAIVFGLGFTGSRLAARLAGSGRRVFAATRTPGRFGELASRGVTVCGLHRAGLPMGGVIVQTIPPLDEPDQTHLHNLLLAVQPQRIVYVSATSVYGENVTVNHRTEPAPSTETGVRRRGEEIWMESGPWTSLILRAAGIYGPGRGAHRRLFDSNRTPEATRRGPSGVVSRIHVDDLVGLLEVAIDSDLCGAFPVADHYPCPTEEVLRWTADYLGMSIAKMPESGTTGRVVDGREIGERLRVLLKYPNFSRGIPQCIREEEKMKDRVDQAADAEKAGV